jgi:UDP-N-acetylmuramate dehydrogenase
MQLDFNVDLTKYNTFGIQAFAKSFCAFESVEDLKELHKDKVLNNEFMVLGGGSNILLTQNIDHVVLLNQITGFEVVEESDNEVVVEVGGGVVWHDFVMTCLEKGFFGIENLSLIPGSVGASPMQNIGAYGVEIKDVFHSLQAFHIATGEVHSFNAEDCEFGYRESVFKRKLKGQYIIVAVQYRLSKMASVNTSYGIIEKELEQMGISNPTPKEVSNAVIAIRQSKLPDPKKIGNSGSFFKNPVVEKTIFEEIQKQHPNMPNYPAGDNHVKLAAGWLIDQCGWKGKTFDTYGVHKNQALVLVNYGGSTGKQIYNLSTQIIEDVKSTFGIELEREVNII